MRRMLPVLLLALFGCDPQPQLDCPSGLLIRGEQPPGTAAVIQAAEDRHGGPFDGTIQFVRDAPVCGSNRYAGCSGASTCGASVAVRWNTVQDIVPNGTDGCTPAARVYSIAVDGCVLPVMATAAATALGHELCHAVFGIENQAGADECGAELDAAACLLDPIDCP